MRALISPTLISPILDIKFKKIMNIKEELLNFIKSSGEPIIKCIKLIFDKKIYFRNEDLIRFYLKEDYTEEEFNKFLKEIDLEYDSGYGTQHLYGTIWFKDGTWANREEYDGSEWWKFYTYPIIPIELKKIK